MVDYFLSIFLMLYVYLGDRYICEAVAQPVYKRAKIEQTTECLINREIMCKYDATIRGYGNRKRAALDRVTVIDQRDICLNNKFVIAGLGSFGTLPLSGRVGATVVREYEPAEVMDDYDDDLIAVETGFKKDFFNI